MGQLITPKSETYEADAAVNRAMMAIEIGNLEAAAMLLNAAACEYRKVGREEHAKRCTSSHHPYENMQLIDNEGNGFLSPEYKITT